MKTVFLVILVLSVALCLQAQPLLSRLLKQEPLIAAHRGGFYDSLPENSLSAFKHTVEVTSRPVMIEFDLRKSKDGTIYIMHDATVNRTTNGNGQLVNLSDDYISQLKLRRADGTITREKVPTFRELLQFARDVSVYLMLDIKADVWVDAISLVREYGLSDRCLVLTFDPMDAQKSRSLDSSIAISCLVGSEEDWEILTHHLPDQHNMLAYVNEGTPIYLKEKLQAARIQLLMDVSEHTRYAGRPLTKAQYRDKLVMVHYGILITDFPIEVTDAVSRD